MTIEMKHRQHLITPQGELARLNKWYEARALEAGGNEKLNGRLAEMMADCLKAMAALRVAQATNQLPKW